MRLPRIPILAQVSSAHFVSHIHILAIPALLPLLPAQLGVNFVELGIAVSIFNVVSAFVQIPLGFAVDRFGARAVLLAGLVLGSASYIFLALFPSYYGLLVAMTLAGAANGVYHPADYAILSQSIDESHMGRAFSIHSFSGFLGSAVTPALLTTIATFISIPAAIGVTGLLGLLAILPFVCSQSHEAPAGAVQKETPQHTKKSGSNILTLPILILTLLFVLLSLSTTSIERFSVSALIMGYETTFPVANAALTAFLFCSAFGVLSGGLLADKTERHGYVAAIAFAFAAVLTAIVAYWSLPSFILIALLAVIGFLTGVIVPSRDMLVKTAAPKGSEGKVFGVVTTGFNIGGALGPPLFGLLLDLRLPSAIFWSAIIFMILTVAITCFQEKRTV